MAITKSSVYGLTLRKALTNDLGTSLLVDGKMMLVNDGYTPNFDTHAFRSSITNQVTGTGYTDGGADIVSPTLVIGSAGALTFDLADQVWAASTIAAAMAGIIYLDVGSAATDLPFVLLDFVTPVSTNAGILTVEINAAGAVQLNF